ncbi:hypothetical protein [Pseudomonas sp.]|uniref:hypothetical protein n=1 Tax=Pseudomonas sp. TaxID=306 RepID=UPI00260247CD|nr:hypothetical protein [Pseudomonas sp.]
MKLTFLRYILTLTTALIFSAAVNAADTKALKEPLLVQVFIHDDVSLDLETINRNYFSWMVKDLESFTQRKVHLRFLKNTPGLTDFAYHGENIDSILWLWKVAVHNYITRHNLPQNKFRKYLLLTDRVIKSGTLGIADADKKVAGIASLSSYNVPAHELGHLLGGTHDAAKILYRPWPCETNLDSHRTVGFALCYVYSDENKRLIADYLNAGS